MAGHCRHHSIPACVGVADLLRAGVARKMNISPWYALITLWAQVYFAAMMITSAWKVISGQGVTWRGRKYYSK